MYNTKDLELNLSIYEKSNVSVDNKNFQKAIEIARKGADGKRRWGRQNIKLTFCQGCDFICGNLNSV